jgi:dTDP-4-dehydrorhamnose 3,5-epimerase
MMHVSTSSISGLLVLTPNLIWMTMASSAAHSTPRSQHGIDPEAFVQDSLSRSAQGVIRGLHLRPGSGEAKIVRCSYGEIFDVVVDLRPGSPTFSRWTRFGCGAIPVGRSMSQPDVRTVSRHLPIAHRIDRPHDPSEDVAIAFDDPQPAIPWPFPPTLLADRDRRAKSLAEALGVVDDHADRVISDLMGVRRTTIEASFDLSRTLVSY